MASDKMAPSKNASEKQRASKKPQPKLAYNQDQINAYLRRIAFNREEDHPKDKLAFLRELQYRHLSNVPVDSISMHYAPYRNISLDLDVLFTRIVEEERAGEYALEVNTFWAAMLRGMGYEVMSTGARVKRGERYSGWEHMVNIVTIYGQRYLSDVGFGRLTPVQLVVLRDPNGAQMVNVRPAASLMLQKKRLDQGTLTRTSPSASASTSTDTDGRVWVYSTHAGPGCEWVEQYCFTDIEFFPEDFAMMHAAIMANPTRHYQLDVMITEFVYRRQIGANEGRIPIVGEQTLVGKKLYIKHGDHHEETVELKNELDRVETIEEVFWYKLADWEISGIKGRPSELLDGGVFRRDAMDKLEKAYLSQLEKEEKKSRTTKRGQVAKGTLSSQEKSNKRQVTQVIGKENMPLQDKSRKKQRVS